jgi:hypothetical protein
VVFRWDQHEQQPRMADLQVDTHDNLESWPFALLHTSSESSSVLFRLVDIVDGARSNDHEQSIQRVRALDNSRGSPSSCRDGLVGDCGDWQVVTEQRRGDEWVVLLEQVI